MLVRDFTDGLDVDQVLLVREVEARLKRDGAEYLKVSFADRTGAVPAMVWEGVEQVREVLRRRAPGARRRAASRCTRATAGRSRCARCAPPSPGTFDPAELLRRAAARAAADGDRPA